MVAQPIYYKRRIQALEAAKEEMDNSIRRLLDEANIKDLYFWHVVKMMWDCEESPVGLCVYDTMDDPAMDNCIFCHDPYERK